MVANLALLYVTDLVAEFARLALVGDNRGLIGRGLAIALDEAINGHT